MRAINYIDVGYLTNNITTDITRIYGFLMSSQHIITAPVMLVLFTIIVLTETGVYSLAGILMVVLLLGVIILIGNVISSATQNKLRLSSKRSKELTFAICGIKSIKFNCWEQIVHQRICEFKMQENKSIFILNGLQSISEGLNNVIPTISGFITILLFHSRANDHLSLGQVFFILSLFNTLVSPLKFFYYAFSNIEQVRVSMRRIQNLLDLPDLKKQAHATRLALGEVHFSNCSSSYKERSFHEKILAILKDKKQNSNEKLEFNGKMSKSLLIKENDFKPALKNVNLKVGKGSVTMIVGLVASGKSSIFKTLLNEMHLLEGSVHINGKIAYFPQESFLLNDTLRANITLGTDYDQARFERVVSLCELGPDIESLKAGEFTEIGANGINLSGGQKQRVSIARGLYLGADVYLLDDCFSALDVHVGNSIFENVVIDELARKGKTVIMTTHVLGFIDRADHIVFMQNGRIEAQGAYLDLLDNDSEFASFISAKKEEDSPRASAHDQELSEDSQNEMQKFEIDLDKNDPLNLKKHSSKEDLKIETESDELDKLIIVDDETEIKRGKLNKVERKETGRVNKNVFWAYFTSGGVGSFVLIVCMFVSVTMISVISEYWVSVWTSNKLSLSESLYMKIFAVILVLMLLFNLLKGGIFGWYILRIGFRLFDDLISRIIKKPMSFFDTTPVGQLLNLTGKDSDFVDTFLAEYTGYVFDGICRLFGIFILAGIANYFLLPVIFGWSYFIGDTC